MAGGQAQQSNSLVGQMLGKDYRVLEQIGMGGMAVVYLVEHQNLLKQFAAKVLSPEHADSAEARARFTQEAHAASQLDHENIVSITDFGITSDNRPFFVMEHLRGRTLADRIDEGPMSIQEVVAVSVPVARALAHAHAEGVIHRDVKPENVFLVQRSQGRWTVKVLDFGIAKVSLNPRLTKMGQALGSPMFMAPEMCKGEDVDQRSDIYSFGILLYLMLTGRVPFEDESLLKVLQMQVSTPLPPPSQFQPDLPPELEAVVVRALEKNPDDRYPTMDAMLFDLEAALPQGSDSMLIQAQFGTSMRDTPFPSQSALRLSQQNIAALRPSQQNIASLRASQQNIAATSLPPAPSSGNKKLMVWIGVVGALVVGGIWGFGYWQQQQRQAEKAATPIAAQASPTPAPVQEPAVAPSPSPEPTKAPRVVGPPQEDVNATDESPTPSTEPSPPPEEKPTKNGKNVVKRPVQPPKQPPKQVAIKPSPSPSPSKAPTGSNKPTGSATVAAVSPSPSATPIVTPTPQPEIPKPSPSPTVAPKPVETGSMDATPAIGGLDVNGPLPSSVVRRSVERLLPSFRACYQAAAKASKQTPAANLTVSFEIDEGGAASGVSASGGFGSLAGCAKGAAGKFSSQAPDVGTAHVTVTVSFKPL